MKKLVGITALAVAGYAVWTKVKQDREDRALWAEVTDSFGGNTFPEATGTVAPAGS
ncbi:DLW-39 family protein [Georgenia sunbinii]|uniref:DLW-39 family protein n=1 Tax=Georgenia sunbinii TaxID=3117728 RepID=UPI002F266303